MTRLRYLVLGLVLITNIAAGEAKIDKTQTPEKPVPQTNSKTENAVYFSNITPHKFYIESRLSGEQLESDRWKIETNEIPPFSRVKILSFPSKKYADKNKRYTFESIIKCDDLASSFMLKQQLEKQKDKIKLWCGFDYQNESNELTQNKFYNDDSMWNKPLCFQLLDKQNNPKLFVTRFHRYKNDIEYVLRGKNIYKKYDIPQTQNKPSELTVLTYNTYLLKIDLEKIKIPLIKKSYFHTKPGIMERAQRIPKEIAGYDVIVLNEVFYLDARKEILKGLKKYGYKYSTHILGSGFLWSGNKKLKHKMNVNLKQPPVIDLETSKFGNNEISEGDFSLSEITAGFINGGVIIVSKWPISDPHEVIYELGTGADEYAKKGVVYAKVNKEGQIYHIFGTHTDAGSAEVRAKQLSRIKNFIDSMNILNTEPVLICGDMNINKYEIYNDLSIDKTEYKNMIETLNASLPQFSGNEHFSSDASKNLINKSEVEMEKTFKPKEFILSPLRSTKTISRTSIVDRPERCKPNLIDYIFYSNSHLKPQYAIYQVRPILSEEPWDKQKYIQDLSDHYAVFGYFKF